MKLVRHQHLSLLVLALTIALHFISTQLVAQENKEVRVGFSMPLTGEAANWGISGKNGALMAYEKLDPEIKKRMRLIFEDDSMSSRQAITVYNKLKDLDRIDAFVNFSSNTGNALAPLVEKDQIPMLSISSDKKISAGRRFAFNLWVTPEEEAKIAVKEMTRRGYKKIARISSLHDWAIATNQAVDKFNNGQVKIEMDSQYSPDVREFRDYIAKLRAKKDVDAVAILLLPGQLSSFAVQLRNAGVNIPIFGFEFFEDIGEVKASKGALLNQWYLNASNPDNGFIAEYQKKFPNDSMIAANISYDAVMLFAEAVRQNLDRIGTANYLQTVKDFSGVSGKFSATGDGRFTLPAAVKIVREAGFEEIH